MTTHPEMIHEPITSHVTMIYDAVQMVGTALKGARPFISQPEGKVSCSKRMPWASGSLFRDNLAQVEMDGVSGHINCTAEGRVAKAEYKIVNFIGPGLFVDIGSWDSKEGLKMKYHRESTSVQFLGGVTEHHPKGVPNGLSGEHLRLGVTDNPPFAFRRADCKAGSNECWEGITPDTVTELALSLNFTYEFIEPLDKQFGTYNLKTETWNGLIGDVLAYRTDMIAMDLSVSFERKTFIDFSVSFMDSGISLAVRGESDKGNLFFFLSPFNWSVWLMVVIAVVTMATLQNLFGKLSPNGEYGRIVHAMQVCKCGACIGRRQLKAQVLALLRNCFQGYYHYRYIYV